ncbi:hypothetical protein GGH94_004154 [Coemansia aciculifera]|uniref:Uncharacterized protein n=1 Tax=Coemansia aciculifera TaxID=417176 RepID=A0A9W8IFV1_9FUNG|nr:hypothetical protein GGH94_004154 [Coemansia aciculifera]
MVDITELEDFGRVISAQTLLTASECQELYHKHPVLLEIREFVVKHSLEKPADVSEPTSPTSSTSRSRAAPPIPRASMRDIANSLLEESRYDEGVRFLTTVGASLIIQDSKIVAGLLAIFKPTRLIEKDLEKRSYYLLHNMGIANVDYSKVWRVDNQRRRTISQSQQRILTCLASVNVQFVKPWFDDVFAKDPNRFWAYLDELTTRPSNPLGHATEEEQLELELYQNRMNLACILLEQMCADLASNMATLRGSMFLKVVSEGLLSLSRIAYPTQLLFVIIQRFRAISFRWCPLEESKIVRRLLDMTAISAICDALAKDKFVQTLAKYVGYEDSAESFNRFIDLLSFDSIALEMIDYAFVTRFRFAALPGERWTAMHRHLASLPPNAKKTAFCLRHLRPQSKNEDQDNWHDVVCLLTKLVQRSVTAYGRRMCHANCISQSSTVGLDSDFPHMLLVASSRLDIADTADAYQSLRTYLETKLPRPSAAVVLSDAGDKMDCSSDGSDSERDSGSSKPGQTLAPLDMIYMDLDLIAAALTLGVSSGSS